MRCFPFVSSAAVTAEDRCRFGFRSGPRSTKGSCGIERAPPGRLVVREPRRETTQILMDGKA